METDENIVNGTRKSGSFIKGFFIALFTIILAVLFLSVLAVILSQPGSKQQQRLEDSLSATLPALEEPGLSSGGTVLVISEEALTGILSTSLASQIAQYPNLEFLGLDIRLGDETVDLLAGIGGIIPGINARGKAVVGLRARIGMNNEGWLSLTPESVRIGRLPLPVGRIFRIIRRNQEFNIPGFQLGDEGNQFLIDPGILFTGNIPGMTVKSVRAVGGSLRIAIEIPGTIEDSLMDILLAASANKEELVRNLEDVLPENETAMPEIIAGFFSTIEDFNASESDRYEGASVSYLEGSVSVLLPGTDDFLAADFGDRIPVESLVRCGKDSFAELVFPGDHIVKITEDSELTINETSGKGGAETLLSLLAGKARLLVSPLEKDEGFRMTAGLAAMAVRGTDFAVFLSRGDQVTLAVLEGSVAVNDEVIAGADQMVSVKKAIPGKPEPIDTKLRSQIDNLMSLQTGPVEYEIISRASVISVAVPQVMNAALTWAALETDTQWEIQYVIEDYIESNPEISLAVDDFFRVNGLEDRRAEFEALFE